METVAFVILAVFAIGSAIVVISHRNPIISAVALALNLVSVAGFYLLLKAQFIAALQILVYTGAVMVLIVFVIMLLDLQQEQRLAISRGLFQRTLAPLLAAAFVAIVGWVTWTNGPTTMAAARPGFGGVRPLGMELFSTYFYPFEIISLLLLAAMVGAVLLAKRSL